MFYNLTDKPKAPMLNWLNRGAYRGNKYASITHQSFTQHMANQAEGISVNSWEAIGQVEKFYHGLHLFQGKKPSYNNLLGHCSYITNRETGQRIKLVCLPSSKQLFLKQYKVLHARYIMKILPAANTRFIPSVTPHIIYFEDGTAWDYLLNKEKELGKILFLAIDSETKQEALITTPEGKEHVIQGVIDLVSATAVYQHEGKWVFLTIVFPWKTLEDWKCLKTMCASHYPKSFQNGLYDIEYLTMWQCPVVNYLWDTQYFMQSITSDFKGAYNLASLAGQWCEESYYWKELTSFTGDGVRDEFQYREYVNYSGLDAHWTAMITLNQLVNYKKHNIFNYITRAKYTPLCAWFNFQGLEINDATWHELAIKFGNLKEEGERKFKALTGFSVNQSAEILPLLQKMGEVAKSVGTQDVGRIHSTDIKAIDGLRVSHPMFQHFIDLMSKTRTADKWLSTFINFKQWSAPNGTKYFRYCLNNFTTASMRLACKASNLWVGGNAQNVNMNIRKMWVPPSGYVFFSIDAPSSEAYTTGYLADEDNLIKVLVDPDIDFHKHNGSGIFEIKYEDITPPKRKLAKPAGFGFFYGMLGGGLLMTMGVDNVRALREVLGLHSTSLIRVCGITISKISGMYPKIRGSWYYKQLSKIVKFGRLPYLNGYAPVICGDVLRDKNELNSCMSLEPQGMSADLNLSGCNNVFLNILKEDIDDKGVVPIVQIHDELVGIIPEDMPIEEADAYLQKAFTNSTKMKSGKVMEIPPGTPVYAKDGKALKADELPRGDWIKGLTVGDITTDKYEKVVKEHQLDFDVTDVKYLLK